MVAPFDDEWRRERLLRETRDAAQRQAETTEQLLQETRKATGEAEADRRLESLLENGRQATAQAWKEWERGRPAREADARHVLRELAATVGVPDPFQSFRGELSVTERDMLAAWQKLADGYQFAVRSAQEVEAEKDRDMLSMARRRLQNAKREVEQACTGVLAGDASALAVQGLATNRIAPLVEAADLKWEKFEEARRKKKEEKAAARRSAEQQQATAVEEGSGGALRRLARRLFGR